MAVYPKVLSLIPEMNGCAMWRTVWPAEMLQQQGYFAAWDWSHNDSVVDVIHLFDIICYPRQAWTDMEAAQKFIDNAHRFGKVIITEIDDDVYEWREQQKSHAELGIDKQQATIEENRASLLMMDGATVSTHRLKSVIQSFAPDDFPVEVVANYIDLDWWRMMTHGWDRQVDGLTIGWAGGDRYEEEFRVLGEAWRRIARTYPNVLFVIQGHQPRHLVEAVPEDRLIPIDWLPITGGPDKPPYCVGLLNIDIMCCTVEQTMFNACKTPIKAYEATASGAAVVGTQWLYGQAIDNGKNGLIANTVDEWEQALSYLIDNPKKRAKFQRKMMKKIQSQYSLRVNAWNWSEAWRRIYAQAVPRIKNRVLIPGIDS